MKIAETSQLSKTSVVAALSAQDRSLFIEEALAQSGLSDRIHFVDEADLDPDRWEHRLLDWAPEILITGWDTPSLPESWLEHPGCPLRYVCHITGTVRNLVPRSFIERGGIVTNWGELISGQVAEHGLLLTLAALRNQPLWPSFIARSPHQRHISDLRTRSLFGLRVGLHGFGSIARSLIPLLQPFKVTITAYSVGVPEEVFKQSGVRMADSLFDLFAGSDVLIECESLRPSTEGSVSANVLQALPDDAVFVNIGRGGLVDNKALIRVAQTGRLRLALDVLAVEPITSESPFAKASNIVLSPHIGGPTLDRYAECGDYALSNVARALNGAEPLGAIDLERFDRST